LHDRLPEAARSGRLNDMWREVGVRAVVVRGVEEVAVETVEDPRIESATDIVMRVTSSAICGSDLHMYEGRMGDIAGMVIGHEPLGVVEEVGPAVVSVHKGDRVTVPTHICCGFCANCVRGYTDACLTTHPGQAGAAYGYAGMGGYRGTDAEYLRVPFADANCLRLPGEPGDEWEHDFVLLADAFPTGYHATELARVSPGDSVAIFGAGAIGLLTAYSAIHLRGAAEVYVVDAIPARLAKAGEIGAIPIDFSRGDPVEQIRERRSRGRTAAGPTWRGEDAMGGVSCGIDAVGFPAHDWDNPGHENPAIVLHALARLINPTGRLGIVGVFLPRDARPNSDLEARGDIAAPWAQLFAKGIAIGMGRDHDERYNGHLRDLIIAGRAKPSTVVTQRLPLSSAPAAFRAFDRREDGYVKVVLDPAARA
jgi:glutathione-independent formaldehyde dehydrogenase